MVTKINGLELGVFRLTKIVSDDYICYELSSSKSDDIFFIDSETEFEELKTLFNKINEVE